MVKEWPGLIDYCYVRARTPTSVMTGAVAATRSPARTQRA
jgi:hypothetical protein